MQSSNLSQFVKPNSIKGLQQFTNPFKVKQNKMQSSNKQIIPEYQINDSPPLYQYNSSAQPPNRFELMQEAETEPSTLNQLIENYKSPKANASVKIQELENQLSYAQQIYQRDLHESKSGIYSLTEITTNLYKSVDSMKNQIEDLKRVIAAKDEEIIGLNKGIGVKS